MPAEEIWITETGKCIPIGEMSEKHVRNTLRMLTRQMRNRKMDCLKWHMDQQDRLAKGEPLVDDTLKNGMHA